MDRPPDFFMSAAGEYEPLAAPRACWERARLRDIVRGDHMLIDIEPALATDVTRLIISAFFRGTTLYPISKWPFHVYVARIVDDTVLVSHTFMREQIELIAWATLFRTREEASNLAEPG